jgi:hypothetical protein
MGDVRVTAAAFLTLVAPCRDIVRPPEQLDVGVRLDSQEGLAEFRDGLASGRAFHRPNCK